MSASMSAPGAVPPVFVTYAIGGARWTATSIARAIRLQYSSIVRSQPGRPLLYVYTNAPQLPIPSNTTFGAPVRIEVRNASIDTSVKGNLSVNLAGVSHRCRERYVRRGSWICLSRTKLELMRAHSEAGERAVWIDLDTLVFKPVPPREFVVGYQHGKSRADGPSVFGGARIAPRHEAYGDLWSLDAATIDKILRMEDGMSDAELPDYDTQGLIAIALTRGVIDTPIVQDLDASQSYGFECVDRHGHPNSAIGHPGSGNMKMAVVNGDLACKGKPIAALSFTATIYAKLALRSDRPDFKWANNDAGKRWLTDYFFNARIAHECKGKAKGARLHSFGACREAFYVAEEKARLREGAAKLRADEDREDSSTGSEDAS